MRRQVECLNRLFETRKCREEILQFLKDEHLINDDVMQNLLHEHHTQHASKMITLFDDLKKKEALQMVDFEWKILPKEFIQLTLVAKTAKKEITYSV
jgi:hypothetical protein